MEALSAATLSEAEVLSEAEAEAEVLSAATLSEAEVLSEAEAEALSEATLEAATLEAATLEAAALEEEVVLEQATMPAARTAQTVITAKNFFIVVISFCFIQCLNVHPYTGLERQRMNRFGWGFPSHVAHYNPPLHSIC